MKLIKICHNDQLIFAVKICNQRLWFFDYLFWTQKYDIYFTSQKYLYFFLWFR